MYSGHISDCDRQASIGLFQVMAYLVGLAHRVGLFQNISNGFQSAQTKRTSRVILIIASLLV